MSLEAYRYAKAESGKLKLRATSLLAEGGEDRRFEAACLLHEAARAEARACSILEAPPATVRLTSAIERCACLIEGLDPQGAAVAWGEVLDASRFVPESTASAMRAKVEAKRATQSRAWAKAVAAAPGVLAIIRAASWIPSTAAERIKLSREIRALLARFPGIAELWLILASNEESAGHLDAAWDAVQRARRLDPESPQGWAMSLFVAARALGPEEADAHLAQAHAALERAPWDVCLMAAAVDVMLARRSGGARERWERAFRATVEGESRRDAPTLFRKYFRALHLLLAEHLAGREPTDEIFYRAGLGDRVVWSGSSSRRTVEEILVRRIRESVSSRQEAA